MRQVSTNRLLAAGAFLAVALMAGGAAMMPAVHAQGGAGVAPIYVVDVQKVLLENNKLKAAKESIQTEIDQKEAQWKTERDALNALVEQRRSLTNPDDVKEVERQLNDKKFAMEQMRRDENAKLVAREVDAVSGVYAEMSQILANYCQQHGIMMIIRKSDPEASGADADNPQQKMLVIQKNVVYHDPSLDLTDIVIAGMNGQ